MNSPLLLSIDRLESIQESGKLPNPMQEVVNIFLAAANDWPEAVDSLDEFEKVLCVRTGHCALDQHKLKNHGSRLDVSKHAWEAEAVYQLVNIFQHFKPGTTLADILNELRVVIRALG